MSPTWKEADEAAAQEQRPDYPTALPSTRAEEIQARLDAASAYGTYGRAVDFVSLHNMAFPDIRALLADRDRLQRRVEKLEATLRCATEWLQRAGARSDAINILTSAALTSETPHAG